MNSALKGHRWRRLPLWNRRKPLHLTITWRGGAEGWMEIHSRGDFHRYPSTVCLYEVYADICGR